MQLEQEIRALEKNFMITLKKVSSIEGIFRSFHSKAYCVNAHGELIGLAFDGNWEAMSSDLKYEPTLQRCIGVDIRYVLFLIDKYGKASNLMNELKIVK